MSVSGSLSYNPEVHQAQDTTSSVDKTVVGKGFCKNHPDVQTHKYGVFGFFGEKHVPCPRCDEDHKTKLEVEKEEHQLKMDKQRFEFEQMKLSAGVGGGASPSALAVSLTLTNFFLFLLLLNRILFSTPLSHHAPSTTGVLGAPFVGVQQPRGGVALHGQSVSLPFSFTFWLLSFAYLLHVFFFFFTCIQFIS